MESRFKTAALILGGFALGVSATWYWAQYHYYPPMALAILSCGDREAVLMTRWNGDAVTPEIAKGDPPCTVRVLLDQACAHDLTQRDKSKQPILQSVSGLRGLRKLTKGDVLTLFPPPQGQPKEGER